MAHDVFLAYSSEDKAAADAVSQALEANDLRVWMAPRDIIPGSGWAESVMAAISEARVFVLIFSSSANASDIVRRELEYAVAKRIPVLPFRIENVEPSARIEFFIPVTHFLDAFTPPLESHLPRLAQWVKQAIGPRISVNAPAPGGSAGGSSGGDSISPGHSGPRRASGPRLAPARRAARPLELDELMRLRAAADARRFDDEARYAEPPPRASVGSAAPRSSAAPGRSAPPSAHASGGPPPALLILGALLATAGIAYVFHKELGALLGWLARGLHLSATPSVAAASSQTSEVDVSAFAPMRAGRGEQFLVQLFLHDVDAERRTIHRMAMAADTQAVRRGVATLDIDVALGERLDFILDGEGVIIAEPHQSLSWRGRPRSCAFLVETPRNFTAKAAQLRARVLKDAAPVGQIRFSVAIDGVAAQADVEPAGDAAPRYRRAFLSYASPDRAEVLKRAQALRAAGVDFFNDLLSLDPGERWEQRLYGEIDRCDVFLLFWSRAAKESQWVRKEIEHARDAARATGRPVEILPIIIEGPPPPAPPDALADLHFNDPLCYVIAAIEKLNALRPLAD
jgi:hypothetical protein